MKRQLLFPLIAVTLVALVGCGRQSGSQTAAVEKLAAPAQTPAQASGPFMPVATVEDIMAAEVMPSAGALWDSIAIVSDKTGYHVHKPQSDAQWEALRQQALILVELTNLLMIKGRKAAVGGGPTEPGALGPQEVQHLIDLNWGSFVTHAQALHDAGMAMLQAVQAKDVKAIDANGGTLDEVCESCHLEFWYPPPKK